MSRDRLEVWLKGTGGRMLVSCESSHTPSQGSLINILGVTYRTVGSNITIDYANDPELCTVCCVVTVLPIKPAVKKTKLK